MTPGGTNLSSIQHVVVLMLENRSFDHMLVPAGSAPLDHTSILKTVQQRWGLPR